MDRIHYENEKRIFLFKPHQDIAKITISFTILIVFFNKSPQCSPMRKLKIFCTKSSTILFESKLLYCSLFF